MNNDLFIRSKSYIVKNYFAFFVFIVIVLALILRLWHTKLGLPYLYNWDEPQTASTALRIMKTGDYNPHFFNYGSMMIYSNFIVDILHYLSLMGHPATADSYLTSLNDIKINADTGWHWTISHPSFYHWNRVLTAILGAGTVLVTYFIGKYVFNKWIGLIAAVFLAILPLHISQSAWASTDAPVAFFILSVVLFSILFIKFKKTSQLIISLIFVGIAIATKYNSAFSMIIPLLAMVIVYYNDRKAIKTYMWFLVPTIPIIVFFIIMPYAIIDLKTFLANVGHEVRHYKILGHGTATKNPGWEHFSFQIHQFYSHLGLANTLLITLGILAMFVRPLFGFVLVLPAIYILYMTSMRVSFHRNFIQVYPFLSLLFASAMYVIYNMFNMIQKRIFPEYKNISLLVVTILTLGYLIPQSYTSIRDSRQVFKSQDTRSQVISAINNLTNIKKVVIAKELRIHSQDLKHLRIPYSVIPILDMFATQYADNVVYVLPKRVTRGNKELIQKIRRKINSIESKNIIKTFGYIDNKFIRPNDIFSSKCNGKTYLKIHSINPSVILVSSLR